jgi:hypothetical protein
MALYFFDSHGSMWVTCGAAEEGAEAFGPRWTARRHQEMSLPVAAALGLVIRAEDSMDWDEFVPGRLFALVKREQTARLLRRHQEADADAAVAAAVAAAMAAYPGAEPE